MNYLKEDPQPQSGELWKGLNRRLRKVWKQRPYSRIDWTSTYLSRLFISDVVHVGLRACPNVPNRSISVDDSDGIAAESFGNA